MGLPCGSAGKESTCNEGDLGLIPGLARSLGEWQGYPLQYSGLENSKDCMVHEVAKSWTQLSGFHFQLWAEIPNHNTVSWSCNFITNRNHKYFLSQHRYYYSVLKYRSWLQNNGHSQTHHWVMLQLQHIIITMSLGVLILCIWKQYSGLLLW